MSIPRRPGPRSQALAAATAAEGKVLVERLALYPAYVAAAERWVDAALRAAAPAMRRMRPGSPGSIAGRRGWRCAAGPWPAPLVSERRPARCGGWSARAGAGERLAEGEIAALFAARDRDFRYVTDAADALRRAVSGDTVRYVVNRNINYTNICYFRCRFCAFSKGKTSEDLRGAPYDLALEEVVRRAREAWARGATEVCMQGGIHPDYTGATYLALCRAVEGGGAGDAHPRLLAAGGAPGRGDAGPRHRRVPGRAQIGRSRQPARHRGGDPRR